MIRRFGIRAVGLALLLTLAGCGGYPQPFADNPGATAMRLALPPQPLLAVPAPRAALLTDRAATDFARAVANALADRSVPALATAPEAGNWRLVLSAELQAGRVVPRYTVQNPKGVDQGAADGAPIGAGDWALAAPATLLAVAVRDAPAIAALLDRIAAAVQQSDPNSLVNRPARVVFAGVTGAPGDGDTALARQLIDQLGTLGIVVQTSQRGADYSVSGTVRVAPGAAGASRVEIQWTVRDPYGHEAGHLLQMNEIPPHSLDGHWGDVAVAVAEEAAGGVRDVIANQTQSHHLGSRPIAGHPPKP